MISACSRPGIERTSASCASGGRLVEIPFAYTSSVSSPSGSRITWCRSRSAKRFTLSSIEGQYRTPVASMIPE